MFPIELMRESWRKRKKWKKLGFVGKLFLNFYHSPSFLFLLSQFSWPTHVETLVMLKDWLKNRKILLIFFLSEASFKVKERGHLIKVLPTRWKTKGTFRVISFLLPFHDAHSQSTNQVRGWWIELNLKDGWGLHRAANEWVKTTKPHLPRSWDYQNGMWIWELSRTFKKNVWFSKFQGPYI